METEARPSLECQEHQPMEHNLTNGERSPAIQSCDPNVPQQPVNLDAAKKPTRQWAAWTREEEESFFTALRQVGKNFEKITCRVQSKNKDQVRHYYYRLVRRMKKLLGPDFSLDAKNSKDTNAAMLRWWTLLEKYSCKASKLHLKPRRFKIFIEALEHQLLKDRKKNVRKRSIQGENCPSTSYSAFSNESKLSVNDARTMKFVLVDTQNIQKVGQGRGSSMRRTANVAAARCNTKGDSSPTKTGRQRRKPGAPSLAVMKKWEKAAMAGVSLVADAAEHLERTTGDKEVEQRAVLNNPSLQGLRSMEEHNGSIPPERMQPQLPNFPLGYDSIVQTAVKLKLQLFPIDEGTRRALEMENHNPHLELTLSTRKKISSVLEHLNRKWGSSSVACGELMLFPYIVQRESILSCHGWGHDSSLSAAEVYSMIGCPPVFRLRYGWILRTKLHPTIQQAPSEIPDGLNMLATTGAQSFVDTTPPPWRGHCTKNKSNGQQSATGIMTVVQSVPEAFDGRHGYAVANPEDNGVKSSSSTSADNMSQQGGQSYNASAVCKNDNLVAQRPRNCTPLSAGEWADSLTSVSVGELLTNVSRGNDADCTLRRSKCHEDAPFTCDSFDAAIATHISNHNNRMGFQSGLASHSSSIWDAEETRDAFSFQNRSMPSESVPTSSVDFGTVGVEEIAGMSPTSSGNFDEDLTDAEEVNGNAAEDDLMDECPSDEQHETENSDQDFNSLMDMYWPDSLGPLDVDAPSCRYYSQDLILSDSLGGLNRLIASSLDAFQNCSFFTMDKREANASEVRATGPVSIPDDKIGSRVGVDDV